MMKKTTYRASGKGRGRRRRGRAWGTEGGSEALPGRPPARLAARLLAKQECPLPSSSLVALISLSRAPNEMADEVVSVRHVRR